MFRLSSFFTDIQSLLDDKPKQEVLPLNARKEATFDVKWIDKDTKHPYGPMAMRADISPEGIALIDPNSKAQLKFFPFTSIKYFRVDPEHDNNWQFLFRNEMGLFTWYSLRTIQAYKLQDTVLEIVDNLVLDRDLFEPALGNNHFDDLKSTDGIESLYSTVLPK